ncbi:MAG: hypothetical protein DRJ08_02210 [Acidobacteria bacterium]|nr:MAG: hypothetical protein DRJ08_02210 [Acidobacteriota bacterium]
MKNKQYWLVAAVFGSMWGISEAVAGTLIHGLSHFLAIPGLSGLVMFPIGFFFMHRAFVRTGNRNIIFQTAAIAAAIKLTALALPFLSPMDTINPVMAILLESGAAFFILSKEPEKTFNFATVLTLAVTWKSIFVGTQFIAGITPGIAFTAPAILIRFLVIDSIVNAALIMAMAKIPADFRLFRKPLRPVHVGLSLVAAIVVNMVAPIL